MHNAKQTCTIALALALLACLCSCAAKSSPALDGALDVTARELARLPATAEYRPMWERIDARLRAYRPADLAQPHLLEAYATHSPAQGVLVVALYWTSVDVHVDAIQVSDADNHTVTRSLSDELVQGYRQESRTCALHLTQLILPLDSEDATRLGDQLAKGAELRVALLNHAAPVAPPLPIAFHADTHSTEQPATQRTSTEIEREMINAIH